MLTVKRFDQPIDIVNEICRKRSDPLLNVNFINYIFSPGLIENFRPVKAVALSQSIDIKNIFWFIASDNCCQLICQNIKGGIYEAKIRFKRKKRPRAVPPVR